MIEDGSKAIRSAVLRHWPDAAIQRCLVHKERNLRGYLPRKDHAELGRLFNRLRRAQGPAAGELAFAEVERFLSTKNKVAQESLREAAHWLSWSLLEAEKGFRRIRGHADLPALMAALRDSARNNSPTASGVV